MTKKHTTYSVIGAIVIAVVAFYGGYMYRGSGQTSQFAGRAVGAGQGMNRTRQGSGFTTGTVLSKDANTLTIQLRAGGSQLVVIASSTAITHSTAGTLNDVTVGTQVTAAGTANPDGSITAQSIQLRPAGSPPVSGGPRGQ